MSDDEDGHGFARGSDPETSHDAAARNRVPLRMRVLQEYAKAGDGGCTIDEVCVRLEPRWPASSISPRSHELLARGLIEDTDERRVTRYGVNALVRRVTAQGVASLSAQPVAA